MYAHCKKWHGQIYRNKRGNKSSIFLPGVYFIVVVNATKFDQVICISNVSIYLKFFSVKTIKLKMAVVCRISYVNSIQ